MLGIQVKYMWNKKELMHFCTSNKISVTNSLHMQESLSEVENQLLFLLLPANTIDKYAERDSDQIEILITQLTFK